MRRSVPTRPRPLTRPLLGAVVLLFQGACAPPPPADAAAASAQAAPRLGYEWTEDEVWDAVTAVRAGRDLNPARWPGGARVAVLLSFDVDNETVQGLRTGDPTVGSLSQGEYGARVALPRIVELLDRHQIPASFFIPAWSMRISPQMKDVIQRSGRHEIAIHGWIHELNTTLDADTEERLLQQALDYYTELLGERPVGYRAPSWNFSPNTLSILRRLGFLYDSSLMADERPYELVQDGEPTGLVELPVEWILDDAPLFNPRGNSFAPPRDVMQIWIDEFDKAWEEGTTFTLTMHPHISGHRSRIVALEGLIDHIRSKPGVWWGTHREAVEWSMEQAGMAPVGVAAPAP
ncbi:MAG: polysaccharide deacetylase [Gemmatimonadota bacterium]